MRTLPVWNELVSRVKDETFPASFFEDWLPMRKNVFQAGAEGLEGGEVCIPAELTCARAGLRFSPLGWNILVISGNSDVHWLGTITVNRFEPISAGLFTTTDEQRRGSATR